MSKRISPEKGIIDWGSRFIGGEHKGSPSQRENPVIRVCSPTNSIDREQRKTDDNNEATD